MRRSQPDPDHAEAVSRRLTTLSAELAAVRGEPLTHTRIRGPLLDEPPPPVQVAPEPCVIPTPGRHASRRARGSLRSRIAERTRFGGSGIGGLGIAHIAVVLALATVAIGLAAWVVVSRDPVPMPMATAAEESLVEVRAESASTGRAATSAAGESPVDATGESTQATGKVTVDVAGRVRRPGIAVLAAGSRVVDALEHAGGAKRGVDLSAINLARVLVDGEQILVGVAVPAGVAGTVGAPGSSTTSAPLVNLNTADQITLEGLPGVGPVTAASILAWRAEHGAFSSVDELLEVDGIGEATLADLAPLVTI